jgi:hypothetical protein
MVGTTHTPQEATMAKAKREVQRITVDLPADLYKWVRHQAVDEGRTLREITIDALERYVRAHMNERRGR